MCNFKTANTRPVVENKKCTTNDGVKNLIYLISLNLFCNDKITNNGLSKIINLTFLDLSINNGILDLNNLTSLELCINDKITDNGISKLNNLNYLNLNRISHNKIITDDVIKILTNLKNIDK